MTSLTGRDASSLPFPDVLLRSYAPRPSPVLTPLSAGEPAPYRTCMAGTRALARGESRGREWTGRSRREWWRGRSGTPIRPAASGGPLQVPPSPSTLQPCPHVQPSLSSPCSPTTTPERVLRCSAPLHLFIRRELSSSFRAFLVPAAPHCSHTPSHGIWRDIHNYRSAQWRRLRQRNAGCSSSSTTTTRRGTKARNPCAASRTPSTTTVRTPPLPPHRRSCGWCLYAQR